LLAEAAAAVARLPSGDAGAGAPARPAAPAVPGRAVLEGALAALTEFRCLVEGDARGALASAERALALLPEAYPHARGEAIGIAALAALAADGEGAAVAWLAALPGASAADAAAATTATALPGVGVAMVLGGRHHEAARAGRTLVRLGERLGLANVRTWGHVLLGAVEYEWDHLEAAERHLTAALGARDPVRLMPLRVGTFALALTLQAQGRPGEADDALERLAEALLRTANTGELARVEALRVRLALRRGEPAPARRWLPAAARLPAHWLDEVVESPPLTRAWASLCLAPESASPAAALAAALAETEALLAETERLHLVTRRVLALALRALAQEALGEGDGALDALAGALELGEPGGLVRTFVDLGPPLARLLRRLALRRPPAPGGYLRRVVAACAGGAGDGRDAGGAPPVAAAPARSSTRIDGLPAPLTAREVEVLGHLGRWASNKEVAAALHVSPETVKRHAANLYAKLGVSGRREALRRAAELGLLPLG
jgi:LuxR family maltose regulon positive regulatory protein